MTVKELKDRLGNCNDFALIWPQIVAKDGSTWNVNLEVNPIDGTNLLQFKLTHKELETLNGFSSAKARE